MMYGPKFSLVASTRHESQIDPRAGKEPHLRYYFEGFLKFIVFFFVSVAFYLFRLIYFYAYYMYTTKFTQIKLNK